MKTYICVKATMMFRVTLFIVYIIYLQIFTKSFLLDRHCFLNQDIKEKKKKDEGEISPGGEYFWSYANGKLEEIIPVLEHHRGEKDDNEVSFGIIKNCRITSYLKRHMWIRFNFREKGLQEDELGTRVVEKTTERTEKSWT